MHRSKPLLILDVDGVFNPFGMSAKVAKKRKFERSKRVREDLMLRTRFHRNHGPMVKGFAEHFGFELVWCTAWNHDANYYVSSAIGLFEWLPVIECPSTESLEWKKRWKYDVVADYAQDRDLAWLDDGFLYDPTKAFQFVHDRKIQGLETQLEHVWPQHGLTISNFENIRLWKEEELDGRN